MFDREMSVNSKAGGGPRALSRRAFLAAGARFAALGGLAAVSAILGRRAARAEAQVCRRDGVCAGCGERNGCMSPAAVSRRRAGGAA